MALEHKVIQINKQRRNNSSSGHDFNTHDLWRKIVNKDDPEAYA